MASVGIRKRVSARSGQVSYQVWWLLDDGSQGAQRVATPAEARALQAEKRLEIARGVWPGRQGVVLTAVGVQRGLQQSVGRRRLRKHWFLASFALHRWLDSPRMVKTADYGPRWRAQALC
jgi:hypothetical protein